MGIKLLFSINFLPLVKPNLAIMKLKSQGIALLLIGIFLSMSFQANSQDVLSPEDLLQLESMSGLQVHPVKEELIFSVSTPRGPNEAPGGSRTEYFKDAPSYPSPLPLFRVRSKAAHPSTAPTVNTLASSMQKRESLPRYG